MIPDETIKQLFQTCEGFMEGHWEDSDLSLMPSQIYRGVSPKHWKDYWKDSLNTNLCRRHLSVFFVKKVIPRYCFDCYKVAIQLTTVVEMFKLMLLFISIKLPKDNTRKCHVEIRPEITGHYKGLIYTQDMEDAKAVLEITKEAVANGIGEHVPVVIKRGCSEFALSYPEYAKFENGKPIMSYKEEWKTIEDMADKELEHGLQPVKFETFNKPGFDREQVRAMLTWVRYAASIGDMSYQNITSRPISKIAELDGRAPFHPQNG